MTLTSALLLGASCLLSSSLVIAQTTTALPPPAVYSEGRFTSPNTQSTQIYTAGSAMIVYWNTTFDSVNLYLVFGQAFDTPWNLISGTSETSFQWIVDDHGNNSVPFSIRAVDASGSKAEQQGGGFLSGRFWIKNIDDKSSSSLDLPSSSTTSLESTVTETPEESTQTERPTSKRAATDDQSGSSILEASPASTVNRAATSEETPHITSTPSQSTIPLSGAEATATPIPTEQSTDPSPVSPTNTAAIGIGASLGGIILIITAIVAALFLRRRRRRRQIEGSAARMSRMCAEQNSLGRPPSWGHMSDAKSSHPGVYELRGPKSAVLVEAPHSQMAPHELEGVCYGQGSRRQSPERS